VLLAVVLAGVLVAAAVDVVRVGGVETWLARHGVAWPYDARGVTVAIEGRDVYIDCRGAGAPTVVLEAGYGSGAGSWGPTLDGIAAFTRVCSWDRPGLGRSAARGMHSAAETAADLRAALLAVGETGPYIVVAHSLGGVYARVFADGRIVDGAPDPEHDGVFQLVMLDTFEPDLGLDLDPALPADARAGFARDIATTGAAIQDGEQLDWSATLDELGTVGQIEQPVLLLMVDPWRRFSDPDPARKAAIVDAWYRGLAARYPHGTVEIVRDTGHVIHLERPSLVIERVRTIVLAAREGP
jgi:pimeloyl-ACP methyl ester carboxylesterase